MRCQSCNFENSEGQKFCGECGERLVFKCPVCGAENPPKHKFCGNCGESFTQELPKPKEPVREKPPSRVAPETRREFIPAHLEGERRQVAILFADIVGFTAMSERLDPERVTEIMNSAFEAFERVIKKYDGTIDKYMGDSVLAVFGAPVSHENDVERALRTALEMRESLGAINRGLEVSLNITIGISVGEVIAGGVGGSESKSYTVMGDVVNTAQRIESVAVPGEILVTARVERHVKDIFEFEKRDAVSVKGKRGLVEVYALKGLKTKATERAISPLFGRTSELEMLKNWMESAKNFKRGILVGISGEAGVGKSRLKHEIRNWLKEKSVLYYEGSAYHVGEGTRYAPFLTILREMLGIKSEADKAKACELLESWKNDGFQPVEVEALGNLLALPTGDALFARLDARGKKTANFLAVRKAAEKFLSDGALVLMFEDFQMVDDFSKELLEFFFPLLHSNSLILICLYRPAFSHGWEKHDFYQRLYLSELAPEATRLLSEYCAGAEIGAPVHKLIWEKTQGNPLFVEELLHILREEKPDFHSSSFTEASKFLAERVPETVHGIITSRIDHLPADVKMTLQSASVIGSEFTYEILSRIVPRKDTLDEHLLSLTEKGFIFEQTGRKEREYVFKHFFVQEVAYRMLLQKYRTELHRAIAKTMEDVYKDRREEFLEQFAYHYEECGMKKEAIRCLVAASARERDQFDNIRSIRFSERALKLAEENPEAAKAVGFETCFDIYYGLGVARAPCGRYKESIGALEKAEALAKEANDIRKVVDAMERRSRSLFWLGEFAQALIVAEAGLEIATKNDYEEGITHSLVTAGVNYYSLNNLQMALKYFLSALERHRKAKRKYETAATLGNIGVIYMESGKYEDALKYFTESFALYGEIQHKVGIAGTANNMGSLYRFLEQYDDSAEYFEQSLQITRETENFHGTMRNLIDFGELLIATDEIKRAEEICGEAIRLARERNHKMFETEASIFYHIARVKSGERSAVTEIVKAVGEAEKNNRLMNVLCGKYYLGEIYRDWGETEKAKKYFEEAVAVGGKVQLKYFETQAKRCLEELNAK